MSERQSHTTFLKALLGREETDEQRQMRERLVQAERDEKCVCHAMHLVAVLALLSVCGLCYEAVFVKEFFHSPDLLLTRLFGYFGFGSVICWVGFFGFWLWQRRLTNKLLDESHHVLMSQKVLHLETPGEREFSSGLQVLVANQQDNYEAHSVALAKAA